MVDGSLKEYSSPRFCYSQLVFWVEHCYFLRRKLSGNASVCKDVGKSLAFLSALTCYFQDWIRKSTAVCLLKHRVFDLQFRPGCLTLLGKHMRTWLHWEALHHRCRRAQSLLWEAAPPLAFCSQGPPKSSRTVGERSAWRVHELALLLRQAEGPCETSGIYSEDAHPVLLL